MAGVEDFEVRVGVGERELLGVDDGHYVVTGAVEDQRGLAEIRVILIAQGVVEQRRGERAQAVLAVVKDVDGAGLPPCGYGVGPHTFGPAARELECGRE